MKKVLAGFLAAFMVFAVAGTAAAFSKLNLTMAIYNATDNEVGLDLGAISGMDFSAQNVVLADVGSFSLGAFGVSSYSDLSVGIFAAPGSRDLYFATTDTTDGGVKSTSRSSFGSGVASLSMAWTPDATYHTGSSTSMDSYWSFIDSKVVPGIYNNYNLNYTAGEAQLSADLDGYVDMYLYNYDNNVLDKGSDLTTDYMASIRIFSNGLIVMNAADASSVPVPGAVILLGSGLLGLAGIRRKENA